MKVYLAAAWSRREEIRAIAERLRAIGVIVTSRWLDEEEGMTYQVMESGYRETFLQERAIIDKEDVWAADAIVRFTDEYVGSGVKEVPIHYISGARHTEMGMAIAWGKRLIVVGGKQNVFDRLPEITHLPSVETLIAHLWLLMEENVNR